MQQILLSLLIFVPLTGSLGVLFIPKGKTHYIKYTSLAICILLFVLSCVVLALFKGGNQPLNNPEVVQSSLPLQFVEKTDWISLNLGNLGQLSIDYFLAVDGVSVLMVFLSGIVLLIGTISSWNIREKVKGYFALYLLLAASIMGCFVAMDLFLFYLFFEFMLLPMYFLIGIWGGPKREYAAIKFFIYTLLGSLFILAVMIGLYVSVFDPVSTGISAGIIEKGQSITPELIRNIQQKVQDGSIQSTNIVHTFSMVSMMDSQNFIPGSIFHFLTNWSVGGLNIRLMAFLALFIGFAIKLPAVPFHTWLPDAHVEAPTPVSVVLAGILLKVGAYGLLRIGFSIFPEGVHYYAFFIGVLGVLAIIYGAMNAMAMKDLKKLIAYSSISHMGFVLLGFASLTGEGLSGGVYQMFSHGIISAALFLLSGVIYDRTKDRAIASYSGLISQMPWFTAFVIIAFFASFGLPGFSGFIGELFVFLGAFSSASVNMLLPRWLAIVAVLGVVLSAAYYLRTLQYMFFGPFYIKNQDWLPNMKDLSLRELLMLVPLSAGMLILGIFPHLLLDVLNQTIESMVNMIQENGEFNLNKILGHQ